MAYVFKAKDEGFCRICGTKTLLNRTGYCEACCVMPQKDTDQIVSFIKENKLNIIDKLNHEDISVYIFLQDQFNSGDISKNYLFQFVYWSFYRLDNKGLSKKFKDMYFRIMQDRRANKYDEIDSDEIALELYKVKNSIQFSFTTKLIHTIDNRYPIYDSYIAKVFGFRTPSEISDSNKKLNEYNNQHRIIWDTYENILSNNKLESIVNLFDNKFNQPTLNNIKKIDFIFWAAGKIIK